MPRPPTISEVVKTLKRVRAAPGSVTLAECEPLFAVLRAPYEKDLEDQHDSLDDQYIDATEGADNLQQDVENMIPRRTESSGPRDRCLQ